MKTIFTTITSGGSIISRLLHAAGSINRASRSSIDEQMLWELFIGPEIDLAENTQPYEGFGYFLAGTQGQLVGDL